MTVKVLSAAKNLYPNLLNNEIADLLGINACTITGWAKKYGWKKSDEYFEKYKESYIKKISIRENKIEKYNYWELVNEYKIAMAISRFTHPFFVLQPKP
jgi:uncharacterized protein YjcR